MKIFRDHFLARTRWANEHHGYIAHGNATGEAEKIESLWIASSNILIRVQKAGGNFGSVTPSDGRRREAQHGAVELAFQCECFAGLVDNHDAVSFQLAAPTGETGCVGR